MPDETAPTITVTIAPDRRDERALRSYRWNRPSAGWPLKVQFHVFIVVSSVMIGRLFSDAWRRAVVVLGLLWIVQLPTLWAFRRMFRPEMEAHWCHIQATADGLHITRAGCVETLKWAALDDVCATSTHLLARWLPTRELMIPRRCVTDESEWEQLCAWAASADPVPRHQPHLEPTAATTASIPTKVAVVPGNPRPWQRQRNVPR